MDFKKLAHDILDEIDKKNVSLKTVLNEIEKEVFIEGAPNFPSQAAFLRYLAFEKKTFERRAREYGLYQNLPSSQSRQIFCRRKTKYET